MTVVMTGSTGGGLGGGGGASFGSGLTPFTQTSKALFTPSLETWKRRADEDNAMLAERKAEYEELSRERLARKAALNKFKAKSKDTANTAFSKRQQELAKQKHRDSVLAKQKRKEALIKPTLGDPELGTANNRKRLEEMSVLDENLVARWLWPTQKQSPYIVIGGLGAEHEDAMTTLPSNADEKTVLSYVENITSNSFDLSRRAVETRLHQDAERDAQYEKEKNAREAEENARRTAMVNKVTTSATQTAALARKTKKEMAVETKKQAQLDSEKARIRFEKAQKQRQENVRVLHLMETDDLRSESEIANERREGSKMSEGSRSDFRAAMRDTSGKADKEAFM